MSWTWNDPIDDTTDWTSIGFLNQFAGAVTERCQAVGYGSSFSVGVGSILGNATSGAIKTLQNLIVTYAPKYTWPGFDPLTYVFPDRSYTTSQSFQNFCTWEFYCNAVLGQTNFTRKYPREISSLTATTFVDGDTVADGDVAYYQGLKYKLNSGIWELTDVAVSVASKFGLLQAGDYIGSWIFTELMAVINSMIYRFKVPQSTSIINFTGYSGQIFAATTTKQKRRKRVSSGIGTEPSNAAYQWDGVAFYSGQELYSRYTSPSPYTNLEKFAFSPYAFIVESNGDDRWWEAGTHPDQYNWEAYYNAGSDYILRSAAYYVVSTTDYIELPTLPTKIFKIKNNWTATCDCKLYVRDNAPETFTRPAGTSPAGYNRLASDVIGYFDAQGTDASLSPRLFGNITLSTLAEDGFTSPFDMAVMPDGSCPVSPGGNIFHRAGFYCADFYCILDYGPTGGFTYHA